MGRRLSAVLFFCLTMNLTLSGCATLSGSQPDITGQWTLKEIDGESIYGDAASGTSGKIKTKQTQFTLNLDGAGAAFGRLACNNWRATYSRQGDTLMFSQAMSTRAYCLLPNEDLKRIENEFIGALKGARIETVSEWELTLLTGNGEHWVFAR